MTPSPNAFGQMGTPHVHRLSATGGIRERLGVRVRATVAAKISLFLVNSTFLQADPLHNSSPACAFRLARARPASLGGG